MYIKFLEYYKRLPLVLQGMVTGVFLGIGFIIPELFLFGIVGIILFTVSVYFSVKVTTAFYFGMVAWSVKMLLVLSWGFSIYPIEWIATDSFFVQVFFILLYLILSSFIIGIGGGMCAFVLFTVKHRFKAGVFLSLVYIPIVWLTSEVLGSFLFSILYLGPGISPNISFSFGYVGYLAGAVPLVLSVAKIGGVYILGAIYVGLAIFIYFALERKIYRRHVLSLVLVVLLIIIAVKVRSALTEYPSYSASIAVVSTRFDTRFDMTDVTGVVRQTSLDTAVSAASRLPVQYIILPEDSRYLQTMFGPTLQGSNLLNAYRFTGGDTSKMLIDSSRVDTNPGEVVLRSYLLGGPSDKVYEFDKQYLVPQGEFMPFSTSYLFALAGFEEDVKSQAIDSAYRPGPKLQTGTIPSNVPAVLFCSEAVNPFGVRKIIQNRLVPFVASPVSFAWFHSSRILSDQVDMMLRIQAVMNAVFIVSAGNMAESKVYTPSGTIMKGDIKASDTYWSVATVTLP